MVANTGQIEIFEDCYKNYQKPKKVLMLPALREQGLQEGQPQMCYGLSPAQKYPLFSYLSLSPSLSLSEKASSHGQATYILFLFHIHLKNGERLDFYALSPEGQRQWIKWFGLLLMFPYSKGLSYNPVKDGFRSRLKSKITKLILFGQCLFFLRK